MIVWSAQAREDWVTQHRFYYARNPQTARRFRKSVMEGVQRLRAYPRMGRPGRVAGTRELGIAGTPFLVVYDENPARVEILHLYDGRQDWYNQGE